MSMSILVLLVALSSAYYCQVDPSEASTNYLNETGYEQKYCTEDKVSCPCSGSDCTIDYKEYTEREVYNVSGNVYTFITRNYSYTFALNITDEFIADQVQVYSKRVQYKLQDGASLTVKKIVLGENGTYATLVRCNGTCTVKDSAFVLQDGEAVSFINDKDAEKTSTIVLDNVEFEVPAVTGDNSHVYSRENVAVNLKNVKFNIEDNGNNTEFVYLFYGVNEFDVENVTAETDAGVAFQTKEICNGTWLVAYKEGFDPETIECINPTVSSEDEGLEDGCLISFIVIVCLADTTLFIILCIFAVLLLLPLIKRKLGKQGSSEYGILESAQ